MPKLHPRAFYLFWWKYFWWVLLVFAGLGLFLLFLPSGLGLLNLLLGYVLFVLIFSLIASGIWAKLFYNSYSFEVSRQSLNVKWGVVIKHSSTIPYQRIQNIDVNRGIMARILGLSEVWVQTAGSSTGFGSFGSLRSTEGMIPGLAVKDAEKLRASILKKIKGRQGL